MAQRKTGPGRTILSLTSIAILLAAPGAPAAPPGGLDAVDADTFAKYAQGRLEDLRAEAHAIAQVVERFEERCPHAAGTEPASPACAVLDEAREDLSLVVTEERGIVHRLVQEGHGDEPWLRHENHDFWTQLHELRR